MIVLDISGLNVDGEQRTFGIGDDVTFAALHLLGHVKPTWTAAFRGLRALAINDPGRRSRLATHGLTRKPDEIAIDDVPTPIIAPTIKVALHGRSRRELLRQRPPPTTGDQDPKARLVHTPPV